MPNYRRYRVKGGTYFFTVNLFDRRQTLLVDNIDNLRTAVKKVQKKYPFYSDAWVILPDHLHAIWTLPPNDDNYSGRWREIKKAFSKSLPKTEIRNDIQIKRKERGIWQGRFWEHTIRDDEDYAAHMDYILYNPVKHDLVDKVADWPYSSFHRLVEEGIYSIEWGDEPAEENLFGERV